jgi:GNAT superfamily N-acetyltransferase
MTAGEAYLAAYDEQIRGRITAAEAASGRAGRDGPVVRKSWEGERVVVVAEAGHQVVCAGWIRLHRGTDFASLWGGSTLPQWRRRGVYRATVAYRAQLAAARGFRYIQVDASPDSRPVLARLGLLPVATTIPFSWDPAAPAGRGSPGKEPPDA